MVGRFCLLVLLCLLGMAGQALAAAATSAGLRLDLGDFSFDELAVSGLRLEYRAASGSGVLTLDTLRYGDYRLERVRVNCPELQLNEQGVACPSGRVSVGGVLQDWPLSFEWWSAAHSVVVSLGFPQGGRVQARLSPDGQARQLQLSLDGLQLSSFARWLPGELEPSARIDGRIEVLLGAHDPSMQGRVQLDGLRFASADGLQAGENIGLQAVFSMRSEAGLQRLEGELAWSEGEAYVDPLYITAGPRMEFSVRIDREALLIDRLALALEGVETLEARGRIRLPEWALAELAVVLARADLSVLGPRFLAPLIAPAQAASMAFTGRVSAGLQYEGTALLSADLAFEEASVSLGVVAEEGESVPRGVRFGPVTGSIPWRARQSTVTQLAVGGGQWERLALGAFDFRARLSGQTLALERVAIPVLDGQVVISDLMLERAQEGWSGAGAAVIEPISMRLLTEAVGLPEMSGVLSASLPGLRVQPGEIALDGALVISLFGGYLQATRLQVFEPFGVASHLFADVEARNLDLHQLTETFSFGSMQGFVDADILGLELARWRPVRFDAQLRSSPGRYTKRISQRAVQNISALGGAGALAALQRGVLGLFESFGYSEIGFSCRLRAEVCVMGGAGEPPPGEGRPEPRDERFVLIRGGGVPALNVIGYNRRVDWPVLLDRLSRVIESNTAPVIQ